MGPKSFVGHGTRPRRGGVSTGSSGRSGACWKALGERVVSIVCNRSAGRVFPSGALESSPHGSTAYAASRGVIPATRNELREMAKHSTGREEFGGSRAVDPGQRWQAVQSRAVLRQRMPFACDSLIFDAIPTAIRVVTRACRSRPSRRVARSTAKGSLCEPLTVSHHAVFGAAGDEQYIWRGE